MLWKKKRANRRCGETSLLSFFFFLIVCCGNNGKLLFLTYNLWGNVECKCGRWLWASVHQLNRLGSLSFFSHCIPGCAVWFTEMWDTSEVDTCQTAASSCFIRHYSNLSFTPFGLDMLRKVFKNEEKKIHVAHLCFLLSPLSSFHLDLLKRYYFTIFQAFIICMVWRQESWHATGMEIQWGDLQELTNSFEIAWLTSWQWMS